MAQDLELLGGVKTLNPQPTDPRSKRATVAEIQSDATYYIGYPDVYVTETGKHYRISGGSVGSWVLEEIGGGGHVIKDATTTFTQRKNLKITGNVTVSDDSVGDATVINVLGESESIEEVSTWDGLSWAIPMTSDKVFRRQVTNGVSSLVFNLSSLQTTASKEVTARIDNSTNATQISTISFPSTWRWASGAQPLGLAAGAVAVLWVKNITATEVIADWLI